MRSLCVCCFFYVLSISIYIYWDRYIYIDIDIDRSFGKSIEGAGMLQHYTCHLLKWPRSSLNEILRLQSYGTFRNTSDPLRITTGFFHYIYIYIYIYNVCYPYIKIPFRSTDLYMYDVHDVCHHVEHLDTLLEQTWTQPSDESIYIYIDR
jgi:hypothetical protein